MGTMQFMPYWIVDYNKNYPKHILKTNDFLEYSLIFTNP